MELGLFGKGGSGVDADFRFCLCLEIRGGNAVNRIFALPVKSGKASTSEPEMPGSLSRDAVQVHTDSAHLIGTGTGFKHQIEDTWYRRNRIEPVGSRSAANLQVQPRRPIRHSARISNLISASRPCSGLQRLYL